MKESEEKKEADYRDTPDRKRPYNALFRILVFAICIGTFLYMYHNSQALKEIAFSFYSYKASPDPLYTKDQEKLESLERSINKVINSHTKRLESLTPYGAYMIVNTTANTFVLKNRKGVIREGICSTGSYILLDAGEGRQWMFKTPKGQFRILGKIVDPIWIKPDWAFVEESLPIPPRGHPDRLEYGTLGDYALTLGQGYLIHGTLYQRFLGLPVTHGCIRLGDEDLKVVYKSLEIGSRVYIY